MTNENITQSENDADTFFRMNTNPDGKDLYDFFTDHGDSLEAEITFDPTYQVIDGYIIQEGTICTIEGRKRFREIIRAPAPGSFDDEEIRRLMIVQVGATTRRMWLRIDPLVPSENERNISTIDAQKFAFEIRDMIPDLSIHVQSAIDDIRASLADDPDLRKKNPFAAECLIRNVINAEFSESINIALKEERTDMDGKLMQCCVRAALVDSYID